MVIASDWCPALPRRAVRIDQYLWINLEVVFGLEVDIICRKERGDAPILSQQDPATLARVGICGKAKDAGNNRA